MTHYTVLTHVTLEDFRPPRCVHLLGPGAPPPPRGRYVQITFRPSGTEALLPASLFTAASARGMDSLAQGASTVLANFAQDAAQFLPRGFTAAWPGDVRHNLDRAHALYESLERAGQLGHLTRMGQDGAREQARGAVRQIVTLARSARVRGFLGRQVTDLGSSKGLRAAVRAVGNALENPMVLARLRELGVTDESIAQVRALRESLYLDIGARSEAQSQGRLSVQTLVAAKALVYGDLWLLASVAKLQLAPTRARLYTLSRVLSTGPRRRAEPAPAPTPPSPAPAPVVTPTPAPILPTPGPAHLVSPLPGAPVPAPATSSSAGTVLCTLPATSGPDIVAVLQPDGRVTWTPAPALPAATEGVSGAPPAPPITASAAPPPARRARR